MKSTLKQIICRFCFYLTHVFEVSRFEVLISRFFRACFSKPPDLHVMGVGRSGFLKNGTANFGWNIPSEIGGPPPDVIPNIPVGRNRWHSNQLPVPTSTYPCQHNQRISSRHKIQYGGQINKVKRIVSFSPKSSARRTYLWNFINKNPLL